jgi:hypothetical protein
MGKADDLWGLKGGPGTRFTKTKILQTKKKSFIIFVTQNKTRQIEYF